MSEPSGTPGRYQRSVGGLVVALAVTVAVVAVLVGARALLSDPPEFARQPVDYLEVVAQAQRSGLAPVYPPELPEGWVPTGAELVPDDPAGFSMTLLTDDERFVGLRHQDADVDDLLEEHVDEDTDRGDPWETSGSVARTWETYTDDGGDTAYAAEVDGKTVLVYGSADPADLRALIGRLATDPVPDRA